MKQRNAGANYGHHHEQQKKHIMNNRMSSDIIMSTHTELTECTNVQNNAHITKNLSNKTRHANSHDNIVHIMDNTSQNQQ